MSRRDIKALSSEEAYIKLSKGMTLLDVRKDYEKNYRLFDVPNIILIPPDNIVNKLKLIKRNSPIIIADNVGATVREIAKQLMKNGIEEVFCLGGGIVDWEKAGLPVKKNIMFEIQGQGGCSLRTRNQKGKK